MALVTVGTATTTSLDGVVWSQDPAILTPTDLAAFIQLIKDDLTTGHPIAQPTGIGGIDQSMGKLIVPNRGGLIIYPGDVLAADNRGGVILIPAYTVAGTDWVVT